MEQCVEQYCRLVDKYLATQDEGTYRGLQRQQERYLALKASLANPSTDEHVLKFKRYKAKLKASNDAILELTKETHAKTTETLRQGLQIVENAKQHATVTIERLEQDRNAIQTIDRSLDATQSNLQGSQSLLTRILKVISTNKILLVLTLLAIAFAIAIIVYKTQ